MAKEHLDIVDYVEMLERNKRFNRTEVQQMAMCCLLSNRLGDVARSIQNLCEMTDHAAVLGADRITSGLSSLGSGIESALDGVDVILSWKKPESK